MKTNFFLIILLFAFMPVNSQSTFHEFVVKDIYGEDFSFEKLKGKKVLIVNTASKCGLTPQYEKLETLYQKYKDKDFLIIGFPANNFLRQEPGTNNEIITFCQTNYGVSFPMMSKISVKGDDIHPLYLWLTSKQKNGVKDSNVSWNFQKYMIDEEGNFIDFVKPKTSPLDSKIIDWIEQ
jgi:glutathione peroxidase